jgi:hypothetical protein
MELTLELFERLVGTAAPTIEASDAGGPVLPAGCRQVTERRTSARLALGKRARIRTLRGNQAGLWQTVMVQDVSLSGIGLLCDEPMAADDVFLLHLPDIRDQIVQIRCTVKRCESGGFGGVSFVVGAGYEQVIAEGDMNLNTISDPTFAESPQARRPIALVPSQAGPEAASTRQLILLLVNIGERLRGVRNRLTDLARFWRHDDDFSTPGKKVSKPRPVSSRQTFSGFAPVGQLCLICWP